MNNKGITLIALVITIIVLLILAGVSIAVLTGENGILNKAEKASDETVIAEAEEAVKLAVATVRADALDPTVEPAVTMDLATIAKAVTDAGLTATAGSAAIEVTTSNGTEVSVPVTIEASTNKVTVGEGTIK